MGSQPASGGVVHGLSSERWDHLLVFPRDHYDPSHESDIRHASAPIAPRVDVHANSLTSPIADAERRRQWEECKKNFLSVDSKVSDTVLTTSSEDKESRTHAGTVADAYEAVEQMDAAEDNIDRLFTMEHGDSTVRREELTELAEDLAEAEVKTKYEALQTSLVDVEATVNELKQDLEAPDFMDRFADTVRSYGHGNYIPFVIVNSWHTADVKAAQSAASSSSSSSSSTNVSFSSGFSGGGGSGRF
ncbi:MAG: hypothetical protein ACTH0P_06750 [Candidatus Corynebacterium faecigallinarum]